MLTVGKSIAGGVPAGAFGMSAEVAERVGSRGGRRLRGRRRRRRHARGQRPLRGGDPRHTRRGPDRRGLRAHDRARRAPRRGVDSVISAPGCALARRPARARAPSTASRREPPRNGRRGRPPRGPRPRGVPASPRAQSRRPDHAFPQHVPVLPGDEGRRRRPPHRGLRGGDRRSALSTRAGSSTRGTRSPRAAPC